MPRRGMVVIGLASFAAIVLMVVLALRSEEPSEPAARGRLNQPAGAAATPVQLPSALGGAGVVTIPTAETGSATGTEPAATADRTVFQCRVVRAQDGTPVPDVIVRTFAQIEPETPRPGYTEAITKADGIARFEFATKANVWLVRALPGPQHARSELRPELTIEPGHESECELRVERGATARGIVVGPDAMPVPGATVQAWCDYRWNLEFDDDDPVPAPDLTVTADNTGRFEVFGAGPRLVLMGSATGMASRKGFDGQVAEGSERDDIQLVVAPARQIRGRVLDPQRQPIARLWVSAGNGQVGLEIAASATITPLKVAAATDDAGLFVIAPVAAERVRVRAHDQRYGEVSAWVTLEGGPDPAEAELVFSEGARLQGTVFGSDGAPMSDAYVGLLGASKPDAIRTGGGSTGMRTGPDGRFVFEGLVPTDRAILSVLAPGHSVQVLEKVVVTMQPHEDLAVHLATELGIAGVVVDERHQPLPGAELAVEGDRVADLHWSPRPTWERLVNVDHVTADAEGRFRLGQLYDGQFTLTVADPRNEGLKTSLPVRSGTSDLVVVIDADQLRKVIIRGTVSDALTNSPLDAFRVSLWPTDESRKKAGMRVDSGAFKDAAGAYRLQGIDPGEYRLTVDAAGYARAQDAPRTYLLGENHVDMALLPERTLRLRVVDQDRQPVAGAWIHFEDLQSERVSLAEAPRGDGSYGCTDRKGEVTATSLPATQIVVVLAVPVVAGLSQLTTDRRIPVDLRTQPTEMQEITVQRDKQRALILSLHQTRGEVDFPSGDPAEPALNSQLSRMVHDKSLEQLSAPVSITLRDSANSSLDTATCTPDGKGGFLVQSSMFQGGAPMAQVPMRLSEKATQAEVTAAGWGTVAVSIPAGNATVTRVVILQPVKQ